jgi:hypothetical protein
MICKGTRIPDMILSLMDILEDDGYMSHNDKLDIYTTIKSKCKLHIKKEKVVVKEEVKQPIRQKFSGVNMWNPETKKFEFQR